MDPTTNQPSNVPMGQQADSSQPQQAAAGKPPPASDGTALTDLDKEWVNMARGVIDQTKTDPHAQSIELAKVRAEYMRIRFDKHIKVSEDSPA